MLKSISINNFKSIKKAASINFGNYTTFIIGNNGSGKSTLVSAIYLTQQIIKRKSVDVVLSEIAPFGRELFSHGNNSSEASFSICTKTNGKKYKFSYTVGISRSNFEILCEKFEEIGENDKTGKIIYERVNELIKTPNTNGDLEIIPMHVSNDEFVLSSYAEERTRAVAKEIGNYKILWLNGENDTEFKVYKKDSLNSGNLDAMAVKLYNLDKTGFNSAVSLIRDLIPNFLPPEVRSVTTSGGNPEDVRYVVFWKEEWPDGSTLSYPLTSLSGGNIRIIQLIFSFFLSSNITCIIGEEIENGQNFGRIKTLLEIVRVLSIKKDIQVVFTTHSSEMLSNISPADVLYVSKNGDGYSEFQSLNKAVDTEYIKNILGKEPTSKDLLDMGVIR